MALAAFKAQIDEITTPTAIAGLSPVAATPFVRINAQASASNNHIFQSLDIPTETPEQKIEKKEFNGDPRISNGRRNIIARNIGQELNIIHATPAEKEELERLEHHGYTEAEIYKLIATAYMNMADNNDIFEPQQPSFKIAPPGYTAAKESYIGQDGKRYTEIYDEHGKLAYLDNGTMCVMPKAGLAATTPAMINDDLISKERRAEINTKVDKDGNIVERDPIDAAIQLVNARNEVKYIELPKQLDMIDRIAAEVSGATTFKSAISSGITADVKPTEPFASAVAGTDAPAAEVKSIMFKTPRAPAPWEKQPTAAAPAPEPAL